MNEEQNHKSLIDTTDCLEAVSVFRGWKNILFFIVLCILLLLQISFWLVHLGLVQSEASVSENPEVLAQKIKADLQAMAEKAGNNRADIIGNAAKQVVSEPNQLETSPAIPKRKKRVLASFLKITTTQLSWLIRFLNFFLILTAALYCLTMLFILKVSLHGRMGGINHIARAFFLSLLVLLLILPWQKFFNGVIVGVMFTSSELINASQSIEKSDLPGMILFYLRFCIYWFIAVVLLILAQVRSSRWSKATLRRLGVV